MSPIEDNFSITAKTKQSKTETIKFMRWNFVYAVLETLTVVEAYILKLILAIMGTLYNVDPDPDPEVRRNRPYAKINCTG